MNGTALPRLSTASSGALRILGLCKRYRGGPLVNDHIDIEVSRGEVFGLLGPNGAGKTTLVKQIVGLLEPGAGTIELDGHDLVGDPAAARRMVSYLPQGALPLDSFTLRQVVDLVGRIRGGERTAVRRRTDRLIEALELEAWQDTLGYELSGGAQRLVGFVLAAIGPARIVILDEPTNDVDPLRRRLLWNQIRCLGREGVAVLLVTHNVLEAEQSVDRLAVIDRGRVVAQGTPSSLKAGDRKRLRLQVHLTPRVDPPAAPGFARGQTVLGQRWHLLVDETDAAEAIQWARTLTEAGVAEEYALGAATLEDAYLRLIGREDALES